MTDTNKSNQIAYTCINGTVVSTIRLPDAAIFNMYGYETIMYNKDTGIFDDYQQRYITERQAIEGHMEAVAFMIGYEMETI